MMLIAAQQKASARMAKKFIKRRKRIVIAHLVTTQRFVARVGKLRAGSARGILYLAELAGKTSGPSLADKRQSALSLGDSFKKPTIALKVPPLPGLLFP
jgi:hypothetical protein